MIWLVIFMVVILVLLVWLLVKKDNVDKEIEPVKNEEENNLLLKLFKEYFN